jgi:ABC-type branched-subunit amino acid transport system ATPase component
VDDVCLVLQDLTKRFGGLIASGKKEDVKANPTVQEIYLGAAEIC